MFPGFGLRVLALLTILNIVLADTTTRSHWSPVSATEISGLLCGIQRYGTQDFWTSHNQRIVKTALQSEVKGFKYVAPVAAISPTSGLCIISYFDQVADVVNRCTNITIQDLHIPDGQKLNLSTLLPGSVVTFSGETVWEHANSSYSGTLMTLGGSNITVQGAPCSSLNGNGQLFWDGIGTNGGVPKPHYILTASKLYGSTIQNLYIRNAPSHIISITNTDHVVVKGLVLDMVDGEQILPDGLVAGHNTDGFDIASSTNLYLTNSVVYNQDDCVAITSGDGIVSNNMYCHGGHGLSIGSVGGKSDNTVNNILFSNSKVLNSQNGCRIKTNSGTTGSVSNVKYENIALSNITIVGIDIQSDYLNGGPTGIPTNGVNITNITMHNIHGDVSHKAKKYHILVGNNTNGRDLHFHNVHLRGGNDTSDCNVSIRGFKCS